MSERPWLVVAALALALPAPARAQASGGAAATAAAATTSWRPRASEDRRRQTLERLAELGALERRADGRPASDDPEEEPPTPEEREEAQARLEAEREAHLAAIVADAPALVDVVAMNPEAAAPLRGAALAALASLGADAELAVVLELLEALRGELPLDLFGRLGELGRAQEGVEGRLLALLPAADGALKDGCRRALRACGGEATTRALLPTLLRGPLGDALDALEVLEAVARRAGEVVALQVAAALAPDAALDDDRRALGHQLLRSAGADAGGPYLAAWVTDALVRAPSPEGARLRAVRTGLEALGAIGDEDAAGLLLRLEAEASDDLRPLVVGALGLVPPTRPAEREWVLAALVERLEQAEEQRQPLAARRVYVAALRRLTGAPVGASAAAWRDHLARRPAPSPE
ncbi:MAG: hypothetical protein M9894_26520 [Planctomycetes bacterium]|nr:hypothetical protein [Planctomycetota bacterium]